MIYVPGPPGLILGSSPCRISEESQMRLYWFLPGNPAKTTCSGSHAPPTPHLDHHNHTTTQNTGCDMAGVAALPLHPRSSRPRQSHGVNDRGPTGSWRHARARNSARRRKSRPGTEKESAAGRRPSSPPRTRRPVALRPAKPAGPRARTGKVATDQFVGGIHAAAATTCRAVSRLLAAL